MKWIDYQWSVVNFVLFKNKKENNRKENTVLNKFLDFVRQKKMLNSKQKQKTYHNIFEKKRKTCLKRHNLVEND